MTRLGRFLGGAIVLVVVSAGTFLAASQIISNKETNERQGDLIALQAELIEYICEEFNEQGGKEIALWETIIGLQPPAATPEEAAAKAKRTETFREYVRATFGPVDCTNP